jgi:hypothetical protein
MSGNTNDAKKDSTRPDRGAEDPAEDQKLSLWQMLGSVLAAAFGVQSSKNRERDFNRGRPVHFIILGIVFTAVFVLVVVGVVRLVLSSVS